MYLFKNTFPFSFVLFAHYIWSYRHLIVIYLHILFLSCFDGFCFFRWSSQNIAFSLNFISSWSGFENPSFCFSVSFLNWMTYSIFLFTCMCIFNSTGVFSFQWAYFSLQFDMLYAIGRRLTYSAAQALNYQCIFILVHSSFSHIFRTGQAIAFTPHILS